MTEDTELLRDYAEKKSEAAFAELVRRHVNLVYSVALRQVAGDAHLAEDVTQQVFTALARKAAALSGRPALSGWLYRSTHFAASDAVRAERRRRTREQEVFIMDSILNGPAAEADWDRLRPVLDGAIAELAESDRDAVSLRFLEGRSFAEVGAKLRLSENAARMRVERALGKLHGLLARRGVTSTAAALGVALPNQAGVAAPSGLAARAADAALAEAKAAFAGAGAADTGTFMSKSFVSVSLVALAAIGSAVYERGVARRAQTEIVGIAREREMLRVELRTAREQAGPIAPRPPPVQAPNTAAATTGTEAAAKAGESAADRLAKLRQERQTAVERSNSLKNELLQLLSVPENLRQAVLKEEKPFRALYRSEGFSAGQIEQFRTLLGRNLRRRLELEVAAGASGTEAVEDQLAAELTVDVRSVLGETAAANFQRYQDRQPLRAIAERVATNLFYTDTPLTAAQAEQMVEALAAASANGAGGIDPGRINAGVAAAAVQAQNLLSAPQVAELRSVVDTEPWRMRQQR